MKYLLTALLFIACNSSTQNKFESAVEKIERDYFAKEGETLESLSIDSLSYAVSDFSNFYSFEAGKQLQLALIKKDIVDFAAKLNDKEKLIKASEDYGKTMKMWLKLEELSESADKSKKIYWVSYRAIAKTNKATYDNMKVKFLTYNNLIEVKLDYDYFK